MPIDIQSLFSDIIETPAQRQQRMLGEGILRGRELTGSLTGLARTQAPLVSALAMQMPQRQEALRRGVGGMLGLDVRTQSEKVQDALKGVDPSDPQSLIQAAQAVGNLGLGTQSAQMRAMAADVTRQRQADELQRRKTEADIAASEASTQRARTLLPFQVAESVEGLTASVQARENANKIFELEYQGAGNQLERDAITAQQEDYLFSIDAAESIYRLSNLKDQETARRNIPQFVSDLRASGNENIASLLERRLITPDKAAELLNQKSGMSEDSWARLSNSTIFNRTTGETRTFEDVGAETTFQVEINGVPTLFGIDKEGKVVYQINEQTLQNVAPGQTVDGTPSATLNASTNESETGQSPEWIAEKTLRIRENQSVIGAIDAARLYAEGHITATGAASRAAQQIGGIPLLGAYATQAKTNLDELLAQVTANIAFSRLQRMRDESKTGGALGNVSNIELALLGSTLGSISSDMDLDILLEQLDKVQRHYQNFLAIELGLPAELDLTGTDYEGKIEVLENPDGTSNIYVLDDDDNWERISGPRADNITFKRL
jgi:hypothetical protein